MLVIPLSTVDTLAMLVSHSIQWSNYNNFCSACAVTVVTFGHLNDRYFYLLTYLLSFLLTAGPSRTTVRLRSDY